MDIYHDYSPDEVFVEHKLHRTTFLFRFSTLKKLHRHLKWH